MSRLKEQSSAFQRETSRMNAVRETINGARVTTSDGTCYEGICGKTFLIK